MSPALFFSEIKKNKLKHENSNRYQKKLLKTAEIYHVTLSEPGKKQRIGKMIEENWLISPTYLKIKNLIS